MNAPVTRRALLGATAAIGVVGLPALVAAETVIAASDPDAELFDLIARHAAAWAEMERAKCVTDTAFAAFSAAVPSRPDALLWRQGDFPRQGFGSHLCDRDGAPRHYGARAAGWLRRHEPFPAWARRVGAAMSEEEAEACEARRLEILAAWDRWQAARHAVEVATGYEAAGEASDAVGDLVHALNVQVSRCQPKTLPGLRALGAWFARQVEADDVHDAFLALLAAAVAGFGRAA